MERRLAKKERKWLKLLGILPACPPIDAGQGSFSVHTATTGEVAVIDVEGKEKKTA